MAPCPRRPARSEWGPLPGSLPMIDPTASRREWLAASAALLGTTALGADPKPARDAPKKKYPFKKSINLWAFPYPDRMSLEQCLQLAKDAGFDGIELNYDLESDL